MSLRNFAQRKELGTLYATQRKHKRTSNSSKSPKNISVSAKGDSFARYFNLPGVTKHEYNTPNTAQAKDCPNTNRSLIDNHVIGFKRTQSNDGVVLYGQSCTGKTRGIQLFRPISSIKWVYFTARHNPNRVLMQIALWAIRITIGYTLLNYIYNRFFGKEKVDLVSESQGMRFLHDYSKEVSGIYVSRGENEALVMVPTKGTERNADVQHHFRFHISDILKFERDLLHLGDDEEILARSLWTEEATQGEVVDNFTSSTDTQAETEELKETNTAPSYPRPIYYEYEVTFPWVPVLLLGLLPLFSVIQSKFRFLRWSTLQKGFPFNKESMEGHFSILSEKSKTKFTDIAGMAEPKQEVMEVVDFLLHPTKYHRMGARVPKGIMLSGEPGVGKTLLAKAVAGEANVNFIACTGSEFVEIFVGVGASRVRELFATARKASPCVVFIDEIDAFARSRKIGEKSGGGQGEGDNTVNALLSELDGFHATLGVVVIAGTNRLDVIDEALLRPGRFDRKIHVDLPTYLDRVKIFKLHLGPLKLASSTPDSLETLAGQLAARTPGNSGADIKSICNESAIIAARNKKKVVDMESIMKGLERVQIGLKRASKVLSPEERNRASYHEAGHAVVNWNLQHADPICHISIVQYAGKKMSHNQKLPADKYIFLQSELDDKLCDMLGGAVAEDLFLNECTSSAAEDSHRATTFAYDYVTKYGMCPDTIGHFSFPSKDKGVTIQKPYSSMLEKKIDETVKEVVQKGKARAREILKNNEHHVLAICGLLKKHESLSAVDLTNLLGPRKVMSEDFSNYLGSS